MTQVTIPKEMHDRMVAKLRLQYEQEFGDADLVVTYSRQELIDKYVRDYVFWSVRTPTVDPSQVSMSIICAHAICTNAIKQMEKLARSKGIWTEVKTLVDAALSERKDPSATSNQG